MARTLIECIVVELEKEILELKKEKEELKEGFKDELELTRATLADVLRDISYQDENQMADIIRRLAEKIENPDVCLLDKHRLGVLLS
jgi:tRNA C32,U32 (ribose-2'-O)-methylase TrmJ